MTLTLNRLMHVLVTFATPFRGRSRAVPRLDGLCLSDRDLADLNLPADVRLRIDNRRELAKSVLAGR